MNANVLWQSKSTSLQNSGHPSTDNYCKPYFLRSSLALETMCHYCRCLKWWLKWWLKCSLSDAWRLLYALHVLTSHLIKIFLPPLGLIYYSWCPIYAPLKSTVTIKHILYQYHSSVMCKKANLSLIYLRHLTCVVIIWEKQRHILHF